MCRLESRNQIGYFEDPNRLAVTLPAKSSSVATIGIDQTPETGALCIGAGD
jgi:hypothetical protein